MLAFAVLYGALFLAFARLAWLHLRTRAALTATRKSLRALELTNNELRQQLNHICEHRACRLARRIGLT